ncbi:endoglucanase [Agrocybe pediades]|nr:endoglucanase [Agrocybe pediades]
MKSTFSILASVATLSVLVTPVLSVAVWGQCGGQNYSGSTTCDAGSVCTYSNPYYSQCLPGTAPAPTTTSPSGGGGATTTTSTAPSSSICSGSRTKFKYFGVNESGAEFGDTAIPGVLGTDYTWPSPSSIDYFTSQGFNTFRIPFKLERMSPLSSGLTGSFDQTYLSGLKTIVNYITSKGAFAAIEPHNYMRYNNAVITSTSDFQTWWRNLANEFKSNSNVIFDVMNEPNGIDAGTVAQLNQAAINGIRAAGATSQLILVEGTSWTGAWTWESSGNAAAFTNIKDPNNNFAIQMHQYLDSDGSGTSATCVSSTIGAERLQVATNWLKTNNLKGVLGEIGAGSNPTCITAVQGALCAMQTSGVWLGALWWAAGPWWGDYFTSIEPPSGAAVSQILPQALKPFL